jgi:3-oxoacyl-[acyl-carrier protein] reductase
MLASVGEAFGHLDALINNAGTTAKWKVRDLESLDLDEWDRTFAVNVRGLFQVTRAAVPWLKKCKEAGGSPAIVNTASIVGLRPGPQPLAYAASKAAVVNLTKTLAWNLGPHIRVNAVAPGWMEGDWMERMLGDKYDDLMGARAKATPLKRCVTADDVAEVMLNLFRAIALSRARSSSSTAASPLRPDPRVGHAGRFRTLSPRVPARYRAQGYWQDQSAGARVRGDLPALRGPHA